MTPDHIPRTFAANDGDRAFPVFATGVFVGLAVVVAIFLLRDASAFVQSNRDELYGHVGASAAFTVAATGLVQLFYSRRPWLLSILIIGASATVVVELAQSLTPSRGVQLEDVTAGLSGVLIAGMASELVQRLTSRRKALGIHLSVAAIGLSILLGLLAFDLGPTSTTSVEPDGRACPRTLLRGVGERLVIGGEPATNGCLITAAGGLGVIGELSDELQPTKNAVVVSSDLPELQAAIRANRTVTLRAEIITDDFGADPLPSGVVALLEIDRRPVFQLMTRANRLEAVSYTDEQPLEGSFVYTKGLAATTTYVIAITIDDTSMTTVLDGVTVGMTRVQPDLVESLFEGELRLVLSNGRSQQRPFLGAINWIEVSTTPADN